MNQPLQNELMRRYQDKNTVSKERVYYEDKRQYLEARGLMVTPKNSRPIKLRDSLREFEVSGWEKDYCDDVPLLLQPSWTSV